MPGPELVPLVLSDAERESLEALSRKRNAAQSLAQRARIVLACAEESGSASLTGVAARLGVSREMARTWRSRFQEARLDGLADAPRPGAPRKTPAPHAERGVGEPPGVTAVHLGRDRAARGAGGLAALCAGEHEQQPGRRADPLNDNPGQVRQESLQLNRTLA